jgi:hypothetical protein
LLMSLPRATATTTTPALTAVALWQQRALV